MNTGKASVLVYVQHLLGIGHLKRAATLARALQAQGMQVTLASGGLAVPGIVPAGVRLVQLPPARAADLSFRELLDENGRAIDEGWRNRRKAALLDAWRSADSQVLVLELFPFGRRQMRFELLPLLELAAAAPRRPAIVCSVRDILGGQKSAERQEEALGLVRRYFDAVLVHGDPAVVGFERTFPRAAGIAEKLHYTGYVVDEPPARASREGEDEVIVSAGGGAVGERLLEAAIEAKSLTGSRHRTWRVLTGGNLPPQAYGRLAGLAQRAGGVVLEKSRPDFTTLLANCALSISQAGYNTLLETVQAGARAIAVPFAGGAETEQALRAHCFAERGLLEVVDESALTPLALAAAVDRVAARPRPGRGGIDLDGARKSAALIERWAGVRMSGGRRGGSGAPWRALADELARWRDTGRTVEFWWRDDDAARPDPALARLCELSGRAGVPLALAVVPLGADPALLGILRETVTVIQHGTDHRNRAGAGEKKTEFPAAEAGRAAAARLEAARKRLAAWAQARFVPVLAPPWNRLPESLVPQLAPAGFRGLSRYGARATAEPAPGVRQVNTHVDLVAWQAGRGFVGEDTALGAAIRHLAAKREGGADAGEPTGWLSHHAVHDEAAWAFLERLFETLRGAPGLRWVGVQEIFHTS